VGGLCIQTLPALSVGCARAAAPRFDADGHAGHASRERPTLTLLVPAVMKALLDHPGWPATDLSSPARGVGRLQHLLPQALVEAFHARGVPVCNVYGATETGPFSIALPSGRALTTWVRAAGLRPGYRCGWATPAMGGRAAGARAEQRVQHYWPTVPAVDAEGWFHSGDLARQAADGSYSIVGRAKELIISGGENIYPAEVEKALAEHPDVAECAVPSAWPTRAGARSVVAPWCASPAAARRTRRCRAHLQARLARFKQPRRYVFVDGAAQDGAGQGAESLLLKAVQ
jgi:fatty-acyl-CoA synthase